MTACGADCEIARALSPEAIFTGNVGCLLQVGRYLRPERPDVWVAHPIDALWASYSGDFSGLRGVPEQSK